jgi:hypothetical protein
MLATRRGSKLGGEISFHDVALDCEAFERVKPQISRTGELHASPCLLMCAG